jgi:hypothetical protein
MTELIAGALAMGYWTAALFFLRYWKRTRDRLFATFSAAFFVLGTARLALVATDNIEHQWYWYWFRFFAYLLILLAVIDKNRR